MGDGRWAMGVAGYLMSSGPLERRRESGEIKDYRLYMRDARDGHVPGIYITAMMTMGDHPREYNDL